jgi:hypothetical protein
MIFVLIISFLNLCRILMRKSDLNNASVVKDIFLISLSMPSYTVTILNFLKLKFSSIPVLLAKRQNYSYRKSMVQLTNYIILSCLYVVLFNDERLLLSKRIIRMRRRTKYLFRIILYGGIRFI